MEPLEQVRVGIVGPSWWVNYWHLAAIQTHPQAIITGICGDSEREPSEVQAKYGTDAQYYTNLEKMLDETPIVKYVCVCQP